MVFCPCEKAEYDHNTYVNYKKQISLQNPCHLPFAFKTHYLSLEKTQELLKLLQNQRLRFGLNFSWHHLETVFITHAHSSSPLHLLLEIPHHLKKDLNILPRWIIKCMKSRLLKYVYMKWVGVVKGQHDSTDWIYTANHKIMHNVVRTWTIFSMYFNSVNHNGEKWGTSNDWCSFAAAITNYSENITLI